MTIGFRPGPRVVATLVLVLTALAGALGGVALDRLLLRPATELRAERAPDGVREAREPRRMHAPHLQPRERYLDRVAEELELTPEQRVRIDSLLAAQQQRIGELMAERRPRMRAIVEETRRDMDEILTPEQRQRLTELRQRDFRGRTGERGERVPPGRRQ